MVSEPWVCCGCVCMMVKWLRVCPCSFLEAEHIFFIRTLQRSASARVSMRHAHRVGGTCGCVRDQCTLFVCQAQRQAWYINA